MRRLAREEGLRVGISAAALAAVRLAEMVRRRVIVTVFPDSGNRYRSETFWGDLEPSHRE